MNLTEERNLSSLNWTINATLNFTQENIYQISTVSQILNISISIITVLFNSFMIKCLQENRSKIPEVIYMQLMSLSISDVLAGVTPALTCATLIESINKNTLACILVLSPFTVAQYAVLLNLCVLSLRRWIVLRRADKPTPRTESSLLQTTLYTLCSWLVSFAGFLPIAFVATTQKSSVNGCLSQDLFEKEMALKIITFVYFGTLILLNVFTIFSTRTLKRLTQRNATGSNSNRQVLQRRAFRQLLAVLMVANMTTLPMVVFSVAFAILDVKEPKTMYLITHFQTLNSLINPILYSANINEIRAAIKEKLKCLGGSEETRQDSDN